MSSKETCIVIAMVTMILLSGCHGRDDKGRTNESLPVAEVKAVQVSSQSRQRYTEVVGTVRSSQEAMIAVKVTGRIETMHVVLGSSVKRGDLLLRISAGEISAREAQARAEREQAERNLVRERELLEKEAATAEHVKSLEERYKIAEAAHWEAFVMVSYTTVTAPFDGVITAKMASVGDLAIPGTPLLKLEDNTRLQVEAFVPEALISSVHMDDTLTIIFPDEEGEVHGKVVEVSPAADPSSRTATVKLKIDPPDSVRPGQFARVIIPGKRVESLFIPSSSIRIFGQMEQVFVIMDDRAYLRLIRTGEVMEDQTEVLAGLEKGEMVAILSGSSLVDGQQVTILK